MSGVGVCKALGVAVFRGLGVGFKPRQVYSTALLGFSRERPFCVGRVLAFLFRFFGVGFRGGANDGLLVLSASGA